MFMISIKNCPTCGIRGRKWKNDKEILVCPLCNAIFSEFGIISEGSERESHNT
ncbi:MAG: hypothetical protein ACE5J7_03535 [Candidatus Aenigmatarchaeota archaeon]